MLAASTRPRGPNAYTALRLYYNCYSTIHEIVIRVDQQKDFLRYATLTGCSSKIHEKLQEIREIENCPKSHEIHKILEIQ